MTLRRYAPIAASRGTVIPSAVRAEVVKRDPFCVGPSVGMDGRCYGSSELDHVRASGAVGMKSASTPDNLVRLCSAHHRVKTGDGRKWRPVLLAYLETVKP